MTDETRLEETKPEGEPKAEGAPAAEAGGGTATAVEAPAEPAKAEEAGKKLRQEVEVREVGPCKKHIKVTINREDIDGRLKEHFSKLVAESTVAGFRPGKAPRQLVERRFAKDVGEQVKNEVLYASLEQLGDENDIAPLSPPNIDPFKIELPREGPMVYEFEVEVRPQFDLPDYKGLTLKRPTRTFTDEDVAEAERRLLAPHGQIVPKPEGNASVGDILVATVSTRFGDRVLGNIPESSFRVEKQLAFKDGIARKFAEQVKGANAGDTRAVDIQMSTAVSDESLRGKTVQASFEVKDVKTLRLPELTPEFLRNFGVDSPEHLHERVRYLLDRQLEHQQRQSAREQVLGTITTATQWQLPEDLLARQARRALARRVMEMRADGVPEQEIAQRERFLRQDIYESTAQSLKEHFVLQKIAEVEKIEVDEDDVDEEVRRLADLNDESPRRLRARLEKEDMLEALAVEMVERKALDLILDSAQYQDVPIDQAEQPGALATVEEQAVPGEMRDPAAEAEAEAEQPGAAPPAPEAGQS